MRMPIRTDRLLLRRARPDDAGPLAARRSDPEVAEFQSWTVPYPAERAELIVAEASATAEPQDDTWWMLIIADPDDTVTYGDLALHLSWQRRSAEIGFTLAREHWGNGYATEAADALVEVLFTDLGVTRIEGRLHPDNVASAMVLERTGFVFEGRTRLSYWIGDDNTDDLIYGMTREDRESWLGRPTDPPADVRLTEVTVENEPALSRLVTHKSQDRFVSPMSASFANALFPEIIDGHPVVPWMRAVEADGELAGFVMLAVTTEHHPDPYLWRLLIDRRHQRRGIGGRTLDLVIEQCRSLGDSALLTSWIEGRGSPRPFYESFGFEPTGRVVDGETEARLSLE